MKISLRSFWLGLCAAGVMTGGGWADEADSRLLEASARGDAEQVALALAEASPDAVRNDGMTALMLAAQSGNFEATKRLLWAGADARKKNRQGKLALDLLNPAGEAYAPLSLLLRCYAFCQENGQRSGRARIPHLAVVNDNFVEPDHPKLAGAYLLNEAEQRGQKGRDDDQNGFVDDVYGWNLRDDEPVRSPRLSIDNSPEAKRFLQGMVDDLVKINQGAPGSQAIQERLMNRYENPLVRQIGRDIAASAGIHLNDLAYVKMLYQASHGTHVAGIIHQYSDGKAKLGCVTIGSMDEAKYGFLQQFDQIANQAKQADNYGQYVVKVLEDARKEAIGKGRRGSAYLKNTGAGVVNMSWGRPRAAAERAMNNFKNVYRNHGKNPGSIDTVYQGAVGAKVNEFALELLVADAAAFAVAFYENPDVLFVIAAGNAAEDNDLTLPSPQYLARFFPNVLCVASVNEAGVPSRFTNRGVRSVQIAAPGENIRSTILAGLEAPMSGTSMASPLVAGVAAGIRKDFPGLSAADLRRILEHSVTVKPELANVVSTSGVVNPGAARALAANWAKGNASLVATEVRRDRRMGPDGPKLRLPASGGSPAQAGTGLFRISNVAGYPETSWRVVMTKNPLKPEQVHSGVGPYPAQFIEQQWAKNMRITSVAGDSSGWNVVMTGGLGAQAQRTIGFNFDQTQISSAMGDGFRITAIAGWDKHWLVVMNGGTGWGNQRYTLPTPLSDSRRDWINKRWAEGYAITAIAGDDTPESSEDGYIFVVTQGTRWGLQTMAGPGVWPQKWVEEHWAKGYRVTSVAGAGPRTLVVMTQGTGLGEQTVSEQGAYPAEWIRSR